MAKKKVNKKDSHGASEADVVVQSSVIVWVGVPVAAIAKPVKFRTQKLILIRIDSQIRPGVETNFTVLFA